MQLAEAGETTLLMRTRNSGKRNLEYKIKINFLVVG